MASGQYRPSGGKLEKTKAGTINRDWVNKTLADKEFEIIDGIYEN
ncbi:MAG: hypothetical protein PUB12_10810 [[Clostridium] aminophilum]|nr:hypothetical protein [[Clostridium] aminophilum]MDD6197351.1 hypothetical protein [[Clostridium] aminophilum]